MKIYKTEQITWLLMQNNSCRHKQAQTQQEDRYQCDWEQKTVWRIKNNDNSGYHNHLTIKTSQLSSKIFAGIVRGEKNQKAMILL